MTTATAPLPSESFPTGSPRSPEPPRELETDHPPVLKGFIPLDDLLAEYEKDEEMRAAMTRARKRVAETMYHDEPHCFSALRLKAGLSQAELAERSKTSQSHIARIEAGTTDPSTETIARLAEALGVAPETAFTAIRYQIATRGAHANTPASS